VRGWLLGPLLVGLVSAEAQAQGSPVQVDAPARGCPARAELVAELRARLPAGVAALVEPGYRLQVERAEGAEVRLQLRRAGAGMVLERRLPLAVATEPRCRALAQAAALVVVRYLQELADRTAASPPPVEEPEAAPPPVPSRALAPAPRPVPPRAPAPVIATRVVTAPAPARQPRPAVPSAGFLGAAGGARAGIGGGAAGAGGPDLRSELLVALAATRGLLAAELGGGVTSAVEVAVPAAPGARLRLRTYPLRAALGVPLRWRGGVFLPAAGMAVDLIQFRANGLADARRGLRVEPASELGIGYRAAGQRFFLRGSLWGGLSLAPRDFDADPGQSVFRTPSAYLRLQIETGLVLWKN
jgi:hypothetical protein